LICGSLKRISITTHFLYLKYTSPICRFQDFLIQTVKKRSFTLTIFPSPVSYFPMRSCKISTRVHYLLIGKGVLKRQKPSPSKKHVRMPNFKSIGQIVSESIKFKQTNILFYIHRRLFYFLRTFINVGNSREVVALPVQLEVTKRERAEHRGFWNSSSLATIRRASTDSL